MTYLPVLDMRSGYKRVVEEIYSCGLETESRGLVHYELMGAQVHLLAPEHPWAEDTGRALVKAIGWVEGLQLIAGEAYPDLMIKIAKNFARYRDGQVFHGAYGPRVRDQIPRVIERLMDDEGSRQAVITVWDPAYDLQERKDIPCTVTMQFMIRNGGLDMVTFMRSNDAWLGLPYDVFQFTLLQKTIARCLQVGFGTYHHMVGSLHLYDDNVAAARKIVRPISGRPTYVDGLDISHSMGSEDLSPVDRWEIIRAATAESLSTLQCGSDGGMALRVGIDCIRERVFDER